MVAPDYAHLYDAFYYAHDCGVPYRRNQHWLDHFGAIADKVVERIAPQSVLDAGCAMGFLVEALRRRGVECYGIDISEYAISQVHADVRPYCWVGSICEPLPRKYDLIVCIEILEHMPAAEAPKAIANLCRHTDDILFSSTPFDYKEMTHFNVQPPEYWAELFAQHGFFRDVDFDASFVLPWAVRFRRRNEPVTRLVREYERRFWVLWNENVELRRSTVEMREQIIAAEAATRAASAVSDLRAEINWLHSEIRACRNTSRLGPIGNLVRIGLPIREIGGRLIVRMPSLVNQPVSQTFVAEYDNLCALAFLLDRPGLFALNPLHIVIAEADRLGTIVAERTVSPRLVPEFGAFVLRFAPVTGSAGHPYRVTLSVPEAEPGEGVHVWRYFRAGRSGSLLQQGNKVLAGELVMSATYGVYPDIVTDRWTPPLWSPSSLLNPASVRNLIRSATRAQKT